MKELQGRTFNIVGGDGATLRMMMHFGCVPKPDIASSEIVIFTGGSDVSPVMYGQDKHPTTSCNPSRDILETKIFGQTGMRLKAGICRGGQFLNVVNGGSMWQDVDNHCRSHPLRYYMPSGAEREVTVTSTHHQMMRRLIPKSLLWAGAGETTYKEDGHHRQNMAIKHYMDEEIVYYPATRSLCFQPHPEYDNTACRDLFGEVLVRALDYNPPEKPDWPSAII